MRSALLILIPLALLIGAFYFVVVRGRTVPTLEAVAAQSQSAPTSRKVVPTTTTGSDSNDSFVGPSSNVWVESRNRRGKLTNKFRAEKFDPNKDGTVDVVFPQAQFYGDNDGIVTLEGSRGKVALSQPGERNDPKAMGSSSPTAGDLEDVIIRFYDQTLNDEPVGEPTLVAQVAKVHFDAIANSVVTVDCVIEGKGVLAERVPVTMRGRDFDFDGYGLNMRWNDRDSRLNSLEVHRGERLLLKNVERFGLPDRTAPATQAATTSSLNFSPASLLDGIVLAEPATAPPPRPPQFYHATFDKDVRITRYGKQLASGDIMRVIVPLGQAKPPREANLRTAPPPVIAPAPVTAPAADRTARSPHRAATKPLTAPKSTTVPATAPTTAPTTAPAGPIEVRWSGPLIVRPVDMTSATSQGEMVELIGAPAWAEENGGRAEARLIHGERNAGRLRLEPGGTVKAIELHDASGAELRSRSILTVDRTAGFALVNGGGTLTMPATATQPDPTNVSWSRKLHLALAGDQDTWIKQVAIEGDADVENKQLGVTGDTLTLGFDQPTKSTQPATTEPANMAVPKTDLAALRAVLATGDAKIVMGTDEARRTLAANRIELGFIAGADHDAALTTVRCAERVSLEDAKGFALACGNLDVKLKPTELTKPVDPAADPLANIDHLLATNAVALRQADGSSAAGERLEVLTTDVAKKMTLNGAPARVASTRGGVEGENILLDPASGDVDVPGPGRFTGNADPKQPDSTMAIAWLESMKATGSTGVCDLLGGVKIDGSSATGTHMQASAKNGRILFTPRQQDASTTRPATRPATRTTTRTAAPAVANASLDTLRAVQLSGDVDLAMQSLDIRTSSLQTQLLDIDWEHGMLTAPQPGRLLVIDGHPAATQPSTQLQHSRRRSPRQNLPPSPSRCPPPTRPSLRPPRRRHRKARPARSPSRGIGR